MIGGRLWFPMSACMHVPDWWLTRYALDTGLSVSLPLISQASLCIASSWAICTTDGAVYTFLYRRAYDLPVCLRVGSVCVEEWVVCVKEWVVCV